MLTIKHVLFQKLSRKRNHTASSVPWKSLFGGSSLKETTAKGRSYSRRTKYLAMCSNADCQIIAHTCAPATTTMSSLPQFLGMSWFEIAHSDECKNHFAVLERDGHKYLRTKPTHPIAKDLLNLYKDELQRRRNCVGRPPRRPSNEGFQTPESSQASRDESTKTPPSSSTRVAKPTARKRTPQEMTPPTRRVTRSSRHVITRRTRRRKYKWIK